MSKKFPPKKKSNYVKKAAPKHNWSEYQKNIFRNVYSEKGHCIINAYAGASKTTSIVESLKYIPKGKNALMLAFNKIIQEELSERAPSYVETLTFHSIGLRAIKQRFGNSIELDENKVFDIVKSLLRKSEQNFDLIVNICDTVAYCKYGLLDIPNQIDNIMSLFGIDVCDLPREKFIKIVIDTLSLDKKDTSKIDFNDMCWFPFVYNLSLGQYDYVYVDEAQDLNKAQLVMAQKAVKLGTGRMIIVRDKNQALYSWRMADNSIVDNLETEPTTKILPLPISYRCPKSVIKLAKKWVPDITCPDSSPDGEVSDISLNELYKKASAGCFILSRTNAPMIKICMNFIRNGVKANIRGRDVGKQLSFLIKKSKKKQIPAFLKWLSKWKDDEVERLKSKNFNTDNVLDRYECLVNLCDEFDNLNDVVSKIDELFNDNDESNMIILSSVHRAKGLERDNVFILRWTFRCWLDDTLSVVEKPNEEANIAYVAATRSKKKLFIVHKFNQANLDL